MGDLFLAIYLGIGLIFTLFWWNRKYKKDYDYAKEVENGVEEGMAILFMLILMMLWPLVAIYKLIKKLWRGSPAG